MPKNNTFDTKMIFFYFLFFFALFFPQFQSILGSAGAMLVNGGIILFISFYYFLLKKDTLKFYIYKKKYYILYSFIFITFFFHIALSIVIGMIFGDVTVSERDLFEFHRPVMYLLIFTYIYFFFLQKNNISFYHNLLIWIFLLITAIGLFQFLRVEDTLMELYTKYHNIKSYRIAAPFTNPYDYAFMMTFFIIYFLICTLYLSWKYLFLFLFSLIMFILPQSRSVAIGLLFAFFIITPSILTLINFKNKKNIIYKNYFYYIMLYITVVVVFLSSIPYLLENFSYLTNQFVKLIESGDVGNSAGSRIEQILFAFNKASNIFIMFLGNGPSKIEMEFVESMYVYQFYRYGLVGIILYFIYVIFLSVKLSWNLLKVIEKKSYEYVLFLTILIWFLSLPVFFIGNNFTEQVRTSFFFYSLLGIIAARATYYKRTIV